jgi:SPP1 family predicted phage head-tail adaptor
MYRPGELDKIITIKKYTQTANGSGGFSQTESVFLCDEFAHVRPKGGSQRTDNGKVQNEASYIFVIRHRNDLIESMFIEWEGVKYNITSILSRGERSMYLEIEAVRGVAI